MTDDTTSIHGDLCDLGDHEWVHEETREWDTGFAHLDNRYQTVIERCADCDGKRIRGGQTNTALDDFETTLEDDG